MNNSEELSDRFAALVNDAIQKAIAELTLKEEAIRVASDLVENGITALTIEFKLPFNFSDTNKDGETPETTKKEIEDEPKISFGGQLDADFFNDMKIGGKEEMTDMARAIQEVKDKSAPNKEDNSDDDAIKAIKIIASITELSRKMTNIFQRHILAYSFNRLADFTDLKNSEGERVGFPEDSEIVIFLLDDKAWREKITEIVKAIAETELALRVNLLTKLDRMLAHYLEF